MIENNLWEEVYSSKNTCDIEQGIADIKIVTDQLKEMTKCIQKDPKECKLKMYSPELYFNFCTMEENITEILKFWTCFEGDRDEEHLRHTFKKFYDSLVEYLLTLKNAEIKWNIVNALYQGPLYYNVSEHGGVIYGSCIEWTRKPEKIVRYADPQHNHIVFLLKKEPSNQEYGIDMKFFDVSQGEEEILCPLTCFSVEPCF